MTELKPEIISMLKRQRRLGILCIGAMVVTAAAGVLFTIEYSKYGEISSIITFAVVFILGLFAANYSAGSAIVEKFSTSGSVFVLLAGCILCLFAILCSKGLRCSNCFQPYGSIFLFLSDAVRLYTLQI